MKITPTAVTFALGLAMAVPASAQVLQSSINQGTIVYTEKYNGCLIFGVANPVQSELGNQYFALMSPNTDLVDAEMVIHAFHQYVGVKDIGAIVSCGKPLPVVQNGPFPLLEAKGVIYFQ
jgi:hypothetical protein